MQKRKPFIRVLQPQIATVWLVADSFIYHEEVKVGQTHRIIQKIRKAKAN